MTLLFYKKMQIYYFIFYITVEEMRSLGIENLSQMFLQIYSEQACQLTDSRQQKKEKHPLKDVVEIVFFAVLAGNDEWADFAADEKKNHNTGKKTAQMPVIHKAL